MKKILALLVCLLTISTGVRADDDRPVRFDQLPAKAQAKWSSLRTELGKKWIASIPLFPKLSFPKPSYAM